MDMIILPVVRLNILWFIFVRTSLTSFRKTWLQSEKMYCEKMQSEKCSTLLERMLL